MFRCQFARGFRGQTNRKGMDNNDNRRRERWNSRLRTGKLFDRANRLLAECRIANLSESGARLRLLSEDRPLPVQLRLFDDAEETLIPIEIVWMKDGELGARFLKPEEDPILLSPEQIGQLGRMAGRLS